MMTAGNSSDEEEGKMNVHATTRRLLSGVMCAGLLSRRWGPPRWRRPRSPGLRERRPPRRRGQDVKMMLLPKFLGILPFDQANQGAQEAAAELQEPDRF